MNSAKMQDSVINWLAGTVRVLVKRIELLENRVGKDVNNSHDAPVVISLSDALGNLGDDVGQHSFNIDSKCCLWNRFAPVFRPTEQADQVPQVQSEVEVPQVQTVKKIFEVAQIQPFKKVVPVSQVSGQEQGIPMPRVVTQQAVKHDPVTKAAALEKIVAQTMDVAPAAVTENGNGSQYASEVLKTAKDAVRATVTENANALQYASHDFNNDSEIARAAVTEKINAMQQVSQDLKNDRHFVRAAVTENGNGSQYASEVLKTAKDAVRATVTEDINALQNASKDKPIVGEMVWTKPSTGVPVHTRMPNRCSYCHSCTRRLPLDEFEDVGVNLISMRCRQCKAAWEKIVNG